MSWLEAYKEIRSAHALVIDAETRINQALNHNPPVTEKRRLNSTLVELGLKNAQLDAQRIAILREKRAIVNPTAEQVESIKNLTMEVERQTNTTLTAAMTLDFATRVLEVSADVLSTA